MDYTIRPATLKDVDFIIDTIIQSEKSGTDKCGISRMFNLNEDQLRKYLKNILEEEIDGCEFSISSFSVTEFNGEVVASVGGWIEGLNEENLPSSMIKGNLIFHHFPEECIRYALERIGIMNDLQIKRELFSYQNEYAYVKPEHRGHNLIGKMEYHHFEIAKKKYPDLKKAQAHPYEFNTGSVRLHEKLGFKVVKRYVSGNAETINYLPSDILLLMEKEL